MTTPNEEVNEKSQFNVYRGKNIRVYPKFKEELQRANDIGGHDVSGTDSKRLTPNEEVIKKFNDLGFNNLGNKSVSDKILKFILQSIQKRDEEWKWKIKNDYIKLSDEEEVIGWRKNDRASGGRHYINKKLNKEIFIDNCGGARIMEIGEGRWEKSIKVNKSDRVKDIIAQLLNQ